MKYQIFRLKEFPLLLRENRLQRIVISQLKPGTVIAIMNLTSSTELVLSSSVQLQNLEFCLQGFCRDTGLKELTLQGPAKR